MRFMKQIQRTRGCILLVDPAVKKAGVRGTEAQANHWFGDGTLKKAHDRLDYMLHNFELGYTEGMPKRAWAGKYQKQTASMLEKIEKTLLTR
ncbi:hypothetical protein Tco_0740816 [Tanacetum coccineum]